MKVTCIQMDMALGMPDVNFKKATELICDAAKQKSDVIVLPETWNTGFFPRENLHELSDTDGQRVKSEIGALAGKFGVNIVAGSVANVKNGKVYNTAYVFDWDGNCIAEYDKTHLFTPMNEDAFFEKGEHLCKFTLDSKQCALIICYDIRFPELTRTMSITGLDVLFVVSQWPKIRIPHLLALTKARAIENQMFVVCCNSAGTAGDTVYGGNSSIHDPWGEILVKAGDAEEIISAECDMGVIDGIRNSINVFNDRRVSLYDINK